MILGSCFRILLLDKPLSHHPQGDLTLLLLELNWKWWRKHGGMIILVVVVVKFVQFHPKLSLKFEMDALP